MRIIVKIDDKCIAVPCADETLPIKWLIWEALKRTLPTKSRGNPDCVSNYVLCLLNGGVLWPEDAIADVLESDEFVELKGKICESWQEMITVTFARVLNIKNPPHKT